MKCPSCGAQAGDGAAECPSCGLIFAKWLERQEKEKREAVEALKRLEAPPAGAPPRNPWIGRGIAGAVVAVWLAGLVLFAVHHRRRAKPQIGEDTGAFVLMRDSKTGDMRRLPIRRLGVPSGPPTAPPAASEQ
jgi:hypothetical protein